MALGAMAAGAGRSTLARRGGALSRRTGCSGAAADPSALARGDVAHLAADARSGPAAATALLIDGGPAAALRLFSRHAAFFVALFDMLGLALLPLGISRLIGLWHRSAPLH